METGGRALASERRIVARLSEACYAKENSNREELASERRIVARLSEACYAKENSNREELASERRIVARLSEACYAKENSNREELASERRATFSEACCAKENLGTRRTRLGEAERLSPRRVVRKETLVPRRTRLGEASDIATRKIPTTERASGSCAGNDGAGSRCEVGLNGLILVDTKAQVPSRPPVAGPSPTETTFARVHHVLAISTISLPGHRRRSARARPASRVS